MCTSIKSLHFVTAILVCKFWIEICSGSAIEPNRITKINEISCQVINEDLLESIREHLKNVFIRRYRTINIIQATSSLGNYSTSELTNELLKKSGDDFNFRVSDINSLEPVQGRAKKQSVFLLDGIESFRNVNKKLGNEIFSLSGYFLLVFINGSEHDELKEIFDSLWSKDIYNVNVLFEDHGEVSLVTFMPFGKNSKCGSTMPIYLGIFKNGSFNIPSLFPEKFLNLYGCPINVLTFADTFAVIKKQLSDGSVELQGYDIDIVKGLSDAMNFKTNFTLMNISMPWGMVMKNGTVTGVLGLLLNKFGDMGIGNYILKANRLEVLDSSVPYYIYPSIFVVPPGASYTPLEKLLQPFDTTVWTFILLTFFTGLAVVLIITWKFPSMEAFIYGENIHHPIFNMILAILGGSQPHLPSYNFARFIFAMFALLCLVLRGIYTGSLYIFLQSDGFRKGAQSLDEIIMREYDVTMFESQIDVFENIPNMKNR
jgi:Ligated ion channel L-glutamate- and glycine-binding site